MNSPADNEVIRRHKVSESQSSNISRLCLVVSSVLLFRMTVRSVSCNVEKAACFLFEQNTDDAWLARVSRYI